MLTGLRIRNFKRFGEVSFELGERVVFVGPNNSGKTSALQALVLWETGLRKWIEKRGLEEVPKQRPGVTINRRDLTAIPVPNANLLWRNLHVQRGGEDGGTQKVRIEIIVEGVAEGATWECGLEFDHANEESFYCRPLRKSDLADDRMPVPPAAKDVRFAFLPPMSGLFSSETRLDAGAINVRLGEGRTAEVLRNLCWLVLQGPDGEERWSTLAKQLQSLFGVEVDMPSYISERGEISMSYRERGIRLDLSAAGRGLQQTLLLLAYMAAHPGAVLLLDEPDAHLELLRQRQTYGLLSESARATGTQLIAASHSEIVLNEAADRDIVIAFVGRPHRIDDRGTQQVLKSLKEIGFEDYFKAEQTGWVLYLEGSTDLAILKSFAAVLGHGAASALERAFVRYVANEPKQARHHFHALREAVPGLTGLALYDRLNRSPESDPYLAQHMWNRREIENYLCDRDAILAWTTDAAHRLAGPLFAAEWVSVMEKSIQELESARAVQRQTAPWGPDIKASDEFLSPLFANFFERLGLPDLMRKSDFHELAPFLSKDRLPPEVHEFLDRIVAVAGAARPVVSEP